MSSSGQETPKDDGQSGTGAPPAKKKFLNGWTRELEELMADWADKAACYRWMHEKTSIRFQGRDRAFNIPVIILSALTAGANFALNSIVGDDKELQKYAQLGLGGASLVTGIMQTFMNFYNYAKGGEAHRVSGISWGKFNRLLCIEMNLHPDERMDALNFLKMFRVELDRLIEQSPPIPQQIIDEFNALFKSNTNVVKPEITGILLHTKVYKDQGARLQRLAAEATVALHYKKGVIKQLVADDLEVKTRRVAVEAAREVASQMIDQQKAIVAAAAAVAAAAIRPPPKVSMTLAERTKEERGKEIDTILKTKAAAVSELRSKFSAVHKPSTASVSVPIPTVTSFPTNNAKPSSIPGEEKPSTIPGEPNPPTQQVTPSDELSTPSDTVIKITM
jgi:hypothetical protein